MKNKPPRKRVKSFLFSFLWNATKAKLRQFDGFPPRLCFKAMSNVNGYKVTRTSRRQRLRDRRLFIRKQRGQFTSGGYVPRGTLFKTAIASM